MRALVAEFVGTFALVLIGAGAVVLSDGDIVTIAFSHGLVLTIGVTSFFIFNTGFVYRYSTPMEK